MRNRRNPAILERLEYDGVLNPGPHRVPREALGVRHDHLGGRGPEGSPQALNLCRSRAALGRRVGLVAHEHRTLSKGLSAHVGSIHRLCNQAIHLARDVIGRQAGAVEGRVRHSAREQATQRDDAPPSGLRL